MICFHFRQMVLYESLVVLFCSSDHDLKQSFAFEMNEQQSPLEEESTLVIESAPWVCVHSHKAAISFLLHSLF